MPHYDITKRVFVHMFFIVLLFMLKHLKCIYYEQKPYTYCIYTYKYRSHKFLSAISMSFQDSKFNVSEDPPYDFLESSTKTVQRLWLLSFRILVCSLDTIVLLENLPVNLDLVRPVMTV